MGKSIGIISIKGGVGKTSCTANIGAALANQFGKKVLIVDGNFSAPNLAMHFGIFDYQATIQDALLRKTPVQRSIHKFSENLHIIPAASESRAITDHYRLNECLQPLKEFYDLILIDSSPNLHGEILSTMIASDELYVVTSTDYPTLSTTIKAVKLAKERRTPIKGLIVNKTRGKSFELSLDEIEEATETMVLGVIPDDIKMLEAVSKTTPVTSHAPKANASIEINKIASYMADEEYKDPRLLNRLKSFFFKGDVRKDEINRVISKQEE
ncbi:AAA family ATPase [Candidatus Woesearchaeota archaeon]|nr:AAA family ATPase [Candidatus Woesearchaeota archaeon]